MNMILNMTMTDGSNSATELENLHKTMSKLGGESVNIARPKLGISIVQAYASGILRDKDEDYVENLYDSYLAGRTKRQAGNLLAAGVEDGNGKKANVSKLRQLAKMACLPGIDGPTLIDRTVTLRGNMVGGDDKIEAPYDAMVKVARAQIASPMDPLSDDQIMDCIRKASPAEKDEIAKLVAAYKAAHKLNADLNLPGTAAAVQGYADAIVELGGEVPPMTKEEKEMAAFMAKAAKMGMSFATGH